MTTTSDAAEPRKPRVFRLDDPAVIEAAPAEAAPADLGPEPVSGAAPPAFTLPKLDVDRGIRWGALLFGALSLATSIALSLWFYRLVSVGLWREDWIGLALRLSVAVAGLALAAILLREIIGYSRLGRLGRLKADLTEAVAKPSAKADQAAVRRLLDLYGRRPELRWHAQRLKDHARDVHDAGALLALADRDLLAEVDGAARRLVTASSRRIATVTAFSPFASLMFAFTAVETLRMLRKLAAVYGGRPGFAGSMSLLRRVMTHLIATGSLALTDDLLGQFVGQGVVQRVSKRLGEGAFNGAMTARVGVAAIEVLRPLPFIAARPPRARDIAAEAMHELWRSAGSARVEKPAA